MIRPFLANDINRLSVMKKCYFRCFDAGIGDCNVIRLVKDNGEQYVIMVDCGKYTRAVKDYVHNVLHNHINLLVATHIDGDHITGMTKMLREHESLMVDNIWYNCYRRTNNDTVVELNEQQKLILEQIKQALPVEFDAINYHEVSAPQGKTLAKTILENEALKRVWRMDFITNESEDYPIDGLGRIVILGPEERALQTIEEKIKNAFNKYFMQVWNESIENVEELQELLVRLIDELPGKAKLKLVGATEEQVHDAAFVRLKANDEDADDSDTNYSSIAFMLECGEHRLAMLGDAFAGTLEHLIDLKYKDKGKPIYCDAIKVSHHGSNGNSSKALYGLINSHHYFIPGGKGDEYPTWGTFGRIAESYKDDRAKLIVFSHRCNKSEQINSITAEAKAELGVETVITEQEYELFEW